jgi:hypothetical protein
MIISVSCRHVGHFTDRCYQTLQYSNRGCVPQALAKYLCNKYLGVQLSSARHACASMEQEGHRTIP